MAYVSPTPRSVGDPVTAADQNDVATDLTDTGWTVPTLSNSWVAFGSAPATTPPQYRRIGAFTVLDGVMKSGTSGTTVFTLPAGYRPLANKSYSVISNTGQAQILISSAGVVSVNAYIGTGSNASVWLDGCTFIAEQ